MTVALGLDAGTVRIGLAASDPTGTLASPVATLPARDSRVLWARLGEEARTREAVRVVVGLPRQMDGGEGSAAALARELATEAGARLGLPVELWDERLTTVQAEREMLQQGLRRDRRRQQIDAVAAAIMLQSWLDSRRHARTGG